MDKLFALSKEYDMLPAGDLVLCAVSGGADSICLLHRLYCMAPEWGFSLACAHFNHNLRGREALRDEEFVRSWCQEHSIPFFSGSADVAEEAARTGSGIEETARILRYDFLDRIAQQCGASRIATAHTANDNAETVLLHLVRGSGLPGLTGIPPRRGNVVRPLLTTTRAEVEKYCAVNGLSWVEDSTNSDETYTRNFLRHQVMPLLEQMNPRVVETLSATVDRLRTDNEYLTDLAEEAAAQACVTAEGVKISIRILNDLPQAVASRAVRRLLERAGGGKNCTSAHISAVLKLCRSGDSSGKVDLPGLKVQRIYRELVFLTGHEETDLPAATPISEGERISYGNTGWTVICRRTACPEKSFKNPDTFFVSGDKISGALILRPRQTGDTIKLPGRGTKAIKKLLIDEKIPSAERDCLPVLADDDGVVAMASFGPDVSRLAKPGEESIEIIFRKSENDGIL